MIVHPYDENSSVYNFFFHPLHKKETKTFSILTNTVLTILTAFLWQIPFWIVNRMDDRKVTEWKAQSADTPEPVRRTNHAASSVLNDGTQPVSDLTPVQSNALPRISIGKGKSKILVLNQVEMTNGTETCGFHAFKNALIALGYHEFGSEINPFEDKKLYSQFETFIRQQTGISTDDLSIAGITEGLEKLADDRIEISVTLLPLRKIAQEHADNICSLILMNENFSVSNEFDLVYLSRFVKAVQSQDIRQAFVIGNTTFTEPQHWVTLVMEKSSDGEIHWYSADSMNNSTALTLSIIDKLNSLMVNPTEFVKKAYADAIGDDLGRKANWVSATPIKEEDRQRLLNEADSKYLPRLREAQKMMSKLAWSETHENVEIKKHASNLNALIQFYAQNSITL